jgi:hypothetical protein
MRCAMVVALLLGCASLWSCATAEKPPVEMKIHADDAKSRTACRQQCEEEHARCRNLSHERKSAPARQPTAGPREVTRDEWAKAYQEAQDAMRKCDRRQEACQEQCP